MPKSTDGEVRNERNLSETRKERRWVWIQIYSWEARRLRVMTCAMFSGMQGERWASVED